MKLSVTKDSFITLIAETQDENVTLIGLMRPSHRVKRAYRTSKVKKMCSCGKYFKGLAKHQQMTGHAPI